MLPVFGEIPKNELSGTRVDRLQAGKPLLIWQRAAVGLVLGGEDSGLGLALGVATGGRLYFSGAPLKVAGLLLGMIILLQSVHGLTTVDLAQASRRLIDPAHRCQVAPQGIVLSKIDRRLRQLKPRERVEKAARRA